MIDPEIQRYNTPGFSGCLSGVKFNSIVPLKAIFRPTSIVQPYSVQGEVVESSCASMLPLTTILIPPEMDPWYMGTGRVPLKHGMLLTEAEVMLQHKPHSLITSPTLSLQSSPTCMMMAGLGSSSDVSEMPSWPPELCHALSPILFPNPSPFSSPQS